MSIFGIFLICYYFKILSGFEIKFCNLCIDDDINNQARSNRMYFAQTYRHN